MQTTPGIFEQAYPTIARWVQASGWVEIGADDSRSSFVRAWDPGGLVWEGEQQYATLEDALQALEHGIGAWIDEHGL